MPHTAIREANVIAMAIAAATDPMRMSRLRMWASSWASTPRISSHVKWLMSPSVMATAACLGLRPVAKALGWGLGLTYSLGIGISALEVSSSMMAWYWGSCAEVTGTARAEAMASLSLNQYDPPTTITAMTIPMASPPLPPSSAPTPTNSAAISTSRTNVLNVFMPRVTPI